MYILCNLGCLFLPLSGKIVEDWKRAFKDDWLQWCGKDWPAHLPCSFLLVEDELSGTEGNAKVPVHSYRNDFWAYGFGEVNGNIWYVLYLDKRHEFSVLKTFSHLPFWASCYSLEWQFHCPSMTFSNSWTKISRVACISPCCCCTSNLPLLGHLPGFAYLVFHENSLGIRENIFIYPGITSPFPEFSTWIQIFHCSLRCHQGSRTCVSVCRMRRNWWPEQHPNIFIRYEKYNVAWYWRESQGEG